MLPSGTKSSLANCAECASAGAVNPLVALLESQSFEAQAFAAAVISDLTRNSRECQEAVAQAEGIEPLIGLLTTGFNAECKAEAAGALWSLSTSGKAQQTSISDKGAIEPLVTLLSDVNPRCRARAAGAIS